MSQFELGRKTAPTAALKLPSLPFLPLETTQDVPKKAELARIGELAIQFPDKAKELATVLRGGPLGRTQSVGWNRETLDSILEELSKLHKDWNEGVLSPGLKDADKAYLEMGSVLWKFFEKKNFSKEEGKSPFNLPIRSPLGEMVFALFNELENYAQLKRKQ